VIARIRSLVLCSSLVAAGCSEEKLSPVPTAPTTTPTVPSTGAGGNGETPPTPGPKVREVSYENPFGTVHDNLLADGDFELSITSSAGGQYGWLAFRSSGAPALLLSETGGICRTGLRCGRVEGNGVLFARGTAAPGEVEHRASVWLKPVADGPPPDAMNPCALAEVYVLHCDAFTFAGTLEPAAAPDEKGWCEISGTANASTRALCIYAEVGPYDVLVDAATLLPVEPAAKTVRSPRRPSDEQRARMEIVRERIRSRMTFGPAPVPGDAQDRFREEL
jgi:hypothetical protein